MSDNKITEKFEFKTNILTSYSGYEQRIKTRQYPRHFLTYDYDAMDGFEAQWLRAQARLNQNVPYFIPMWQDVAYLEKDYTKNDKELFIQPEFMYGFRDCQYIEIFSGDDVTQGGINQVRKVTRYIGNAIVIKQGIKRSMSTKNTWIMPLRKCSIQPMSGYNYVYANGANTTLNYEDLLEKYTIDIAKKYKFDYDEDLELFNLFDLPKTYNNKEVFLFTPSWVQDDDMQLTVDKNVNRLDNETGIYLYDLKNNRSYDTNMWEFTLREKKAINYMIKFFKNMGGEFKSFYCPTWANDIQPAFNIQAGKNIIYTKISNMAQFYLTNGRKKHIVIFTKDWHSYIYTIIGYATETIDDSKYCKILLDRQITENFKLDNVWMISYFNNVRFDSDILELNYETNVVANCVLSFKEIDEL